MARVMDILIVKGHFFRNMFPRPEETQVSFWRSEKKKPTVNALSLCIQRLHSADCSAQKSFIRFLEISLPIL